MFHSPCCWIASVVVAALMASAAHGQLPPGCTTPIGQPNCGPGGQAAGPHGFCRPAGHGDGCGCDHCRRCQPPCGPPCQPCMPPPPPQLPVMMQEQGSFVAPPLSGTAQGETNRVGVETGTIILPEVRLRLPRFELPTVFRTRQGARMLTEAGEAPWVSQGQSNAFAPQNEAILAQQVQALQNALAQASPASAQTQAEAQAASQAAQAAQAEMERMRCELNRLRALENAINQAQQAMRDNPGCQGAQGAQGGPSPTPAIHCPTPAMTPPTPTPDEGARGPYIPARPIPAEPLYQPVTVPVTAPAAERAATYQAPPVNGYPPAESAPPHEVRPIGYAAPLPQHSVIRQPQLLPVSHAPIRQPVAPQGRILGLSPR